MISGASESAETLSWKSKGSTTNANIFAREGGGGGVSHLPKKFLQVAQIVMQQSKRNKGHAINQHRTTYEWNIFLYMPSNISS